MRRRLLERLEQRVERLGREHVDFVDDVDLLAQDRRLKAHGFGAARGSHRCRGCSRRPSRCGRPSCRSRCSGTQSTCRTARPCRSPGRSRSSAPCRRCARAWSCRSRAGRRTERVVHATGRERVAERARDMLLADDLAERGRTIFAREDQVGHAGSSALYPVGLSLQRHRSADLLGGHDDLVAQISERIGGGILVERAPAHEGACPRTSRAYEMPVRRCRRCLRGTTPHRAGDSATR